MPQGEIDPNTRRKNVTGHWRQCSVDIDPVARKINERCFSCAERILVGKLLSQQRGETPEGFLNVNKLHVSYAHVFSSKPIEK